MYTLNTAVLCNIIITSAQWCEAQPQCRRQKLADLLFVPMQRLTRYPLLLRAIAQQTDSDADMADLGTMMARVTENSK